MITVCDYIRFARPMTTGTGNLYVLEIYTVFMNNFVINHGIVRPHKLFTFIAEPFRKWISIKSKSINSILFCYDLGQTKVWMKTYKMKLKLKSSFGMKITTNCSTLCESNSCYSRSKSMHWAHKICIDFNAEQFSSISAPSSQFQKQKHIRWFIQLGRICCMTRLPHFTAL